MKVGNKTQLLVMSAYKSVKMDVYRDTYRRMQNIYLYIYVIIFEDTFIELIFTFTLLLPKDASHLDFLDIKYILTSTALLHQFLKSFHFLISILFR